MQADLPIPAPRDPAKPTPLESVRIIDFSHFIAGPYGTLILADMGAEVIKLEHVDGGDSFRSYPPFVMDESVPYQWANRNKKSVQIDLKSERGRALVLDMIAASDVVVENFSSGVMERLGLDYESVRKHKADIIYCSIASYGRSGPFAHRVGLDPILQAESGFMSMIGHPDREPTRAGPSVVDVTTASMAANAILGALIAHGRTGKGQYVEVTLLETAINMLGNFSQAYLATGVVPTRFGNTQITASPVGYFETADGPIYLACANDRLYQRLVCDVLDSPELATHPDYASSAKRRDNQEALHALIAQRLRQAPREEWLRKMHAAMVPAGAIRSVGESLDSAEVRELGLVGRVPHPTQGWVPCVGLPMHFSGTPLAYPVCAPLLGSHTSEVLEQVLGCDAQTIAQLVADGIIVQGAPA